MILRQRRIIPSFLVVLALSIPNAAKTADSPAQTEIYTAGENGYAAFRIPAIVCTTKGTLLAFAEGRVKGQGDNGDIDAVLKRSTDGGRTWSKLAVIGDMGT